MKIISTVVIKIVPIKVQKGQDLIISHPLSANSTKLIPPNEAIRFGTVITAVRTAINLIVSFILFDAEDK